MYIFFASTLYPWGYTQSCVSRRVLFYKLITFLASSLHLNINFVITKHTDFSKLNKFTFSEENLCGFTQKQAMKCRTKYTQ